MYTQVNGARLYFDVDGESLTPDGPSMREKPTVIMVHGGPGADHTVSKPYFSQLTDIAQVIYYDHRGNGRSDCSDESNWTLEQWGADLKALCDALGIEKPILIGTSFGGFVTLSYATQFPDHAGGLVLVSTAAKVDFPAVFKAFARRGGKAIGDIAEAYWTNPTDEGRALYRDKCVPYYSYREKASQDWLSRILWRNETALHFNGPNNEHGRMDFRAELGKITCPALVMVGDEDPITPPEFSEVIADGLGSDDLEFIRFQKCGHGVVGDKPDEALAAIRRFVSAAS
ncbi:MAG: alpha/beta hydrolase [Sulfitobacter sp.]|nr:alpha/beta hydrolase [Sulfitobacter sp.]